MWTYLKSLPALELHLGNFILYPFWYVRNGIGHGEFDTKNKVLKNNKSFKRETWRNEGYMEAFSASRLDHVTNEKNYIHYSLLSPKGQYS